MSSTRIYWSVAASSPNGVDHRHRGKTFTIKLGVVWRFCREQPGRLRFCQRHAARKSQPRRHRRFYSDECSRCYNPDPSSSSGLEHGAQGDPATGLAGRRGNTSARVCDPATLGRDARPFPGPSVPLVAVRRARCPPVDSHAEDRCDDVINT
jgi:hypothetical protein